MATEFINIAVAQRGAQSVRREIADIGLGADAAGRSVALLQRALSALGLGFGLSQLKQAVDGYTNLSNRLRLVSTSTANLAQLQEAVFQAAQRTRTPFEALAQLYSRTALNAAALGLSQQELLDLTESVAQAFKISGATSAEASGAIIQFTQGLAQGTLRGQELLSVLEQAPRLAQAIAAGMGVGVYDLKRLGEQGKITSEQIVAALKKAGPDLDAEFAKIRPTIEDAFTVLYTGFMQTIGQMDQASGASATLAKAMIALGSNTDAMRIGLVALAGVLLVAFLPAIGAALAATLLFTAALLANPLTWIVAAVAGLILFGDQIKVSTDGAVSLMDWFKAAFQFIAEAVGPVAQTLMGWFGAAWNFLMESWGQVSKFFGDNFGNLIELGGVLYRVYVSLFAGMVRAIGAVFGNLPAVIENVFKNAMNAAITVVEVALKGIAAPINDLLKLVNLPTLPDVDLDDFKFKLSKEAEDIPGIIGGAFAEGFADGDRAAQGMLATVGNALDQINAKAREIGLARVAGEKPGPDGTLPNIPGVPVDRAEPPDKKELTRLASLLKDIKGPQGELIQGQRDLNTLMAQGKISQEEYNQKLREFQLAAFDAEKTIEGGLKAGFLTLYEEIEDVGSLVQDAFVNAFNAAEDALVSFVTTGKLDFKSLIDGMLADLARLALRKAILGPLMSIIGGGLGFRDGGLASFAEGGRVRGPGTGTSDSILARLSNGEFVVNADATSRFLPMLEAMNENRSLPTFAAGGRVSGGGSGTTVQIIDQRSGGAPVEESKDANGNVRVIIRDEVAKIHRETRRQRQAEVRGFVVGDKAVGNM